MVKVYDSSDVDERTALLGDEGRINEGASDLEGVNQNLIKPDYIINASIENSSLSTAQVSPEKGKQNSFFTIFSLWNAMMGTSILTMPWAIEQAGLSLGIICMVLVMGLCLYTAFRVMQLPSLLGVDIRVAEYSDLCDILLFRGCRWIAMVTSVIALLGAVIVYWILMSNFLYNIVTFIYYKSTNSTFSLIGNSSHSDVYCPVPVPEHFNTSLGRMNLISKEPEDPLFEKIWNLETSPLFLVIIVMLLANYKSATCFTKLNSLAFVSVIYLFFFVFWKANNWGIHVNTHDKNAWDYIPQFKSNFPALIGTLTLAFFIHNCVISIVKNQQKPENNVRDLTLAYIFVCITYLIVGVVFYVSFPLDKLCMEDNLLNNFHDADLMTFLARLCLLIQMSAVLPLIMFVLRSQVLHQVFPNKPHEYKHILPVNIVLIIIGVLFAIFYPHVSFLIRYTGAICGLVYTFGLPCLTYLEVLKRSGQSTYFQTAVHWFIILLGILNVISQFLVKQRF